MSSSRRMWTGAPLVLFRYPGLLVALLVGAALLGTAAASYPLFLSATEARLLSAEIASPLVTRYGAGLAYVGTEVPLRPQGAEPPLYDRRGELFERLAARSPELGPAESSVLGPQVSVARPDRPSETRTIRLFGGQGAESHVRVVSGEDGPGVWLPDEVAVPLRIHPGDRVAVTLGSGDPVLLPVDGVFRALHLEPRRGYWLQYDAEIYPSGGCREGPCPPPAPFVLLDLDLAVPVLEDLGAETATFGWQAPVRAGLEPTLDDARDLSAFAGRFRRQIAGRPYGEVFDCCHETRFRGGLAQETRLETDIHRLLRVVQERVGAIRPPAKVLLAAALAVATVVVAAAATLGVGGRRTEFRLLEADGRSPAWIAARACLEAFPACLVGSAAGVGASFVLLEAFAADAPVAGSAAAAAALAGTAATIGSVVAVGLATAAAYVHAAEHVPTPLRVLRRVPWGVVLLLLAGLALRRLSNAPAVGPGGPSLAMLALPVALIGGVALIGARAFRAGFRSLRDRAGGWGPPGYLAVRRLASAPERAVLFVAASGLCLGLFVQASAQVRSLEESVDAKAGVFVGGDVQAWVAPELALPEDFPYPTTRVVRSVEAGTAIPGGGLIDLLAIDPGTFERAASWRARYADEPLEVLLGRMREGSGAAVPTLVAGGGIGTPVELRVGEATVAVEVVGRAEAFPGMLGERPLVVVDRDVLAAHVGEATDPLGSNVRTELWVRGPAEEILRALRGLPIQPVFVTTAERVKDVPYIAAAIGTFVVLTLLAGAAAALVVVALFTYLQARERSEAVARGLSLRMGMGPATNARSLLLELSAMLGWSLLVAVPVALVAAVILGGLADPLPAIPPDPVLVVPVVPILVAVPLLVLVSWAGARLLERRASRVPLGEVMRVAE